MRPVRHMVLFVSILTLPFAALAQITDTAKIDQAMGRQGQKIADVYKFGFPRTDLHVTVRGVAIKPGLALGSWAAFLGTDDAAMVMGDLVLLPEQVNPVVEKLRSAGFDITAVHNHLIDEAPHVMYVHYMGHGSAFRLAGSLHEALAVSKTPLEKPAASTEAAPPDWVKTVDDSLGRKGNFKGGVLSYSVPRSETITMDGTTIPPAAGVAQAINFQAADSGNVATTGDFVLTAQEVNPVISALEANHISVTGLHSHMLAEQPRLFFMHFWAVGTPSTVAPGISAALKQISVK